MQQSYLKEATMTFPIKICSSPYINHSPIRANELIETLFLSKIDSCVEHNFSIASLSPMIKYTARHVTIILFASTFKNRRSMSMRTKFSAGGIPWQICFHIRLHFDRLRLKCYL